MSLRITAENHESSVTLLLVLGLAIVVTVGTVSVYADTQPSKTVNAQPGGMEVCTPSGCHEVSGNYMPPLPSNSTTQYGGATVTCNNGVCRSGPTCNNGNCNGIPPNAQTARPSTPGQNYTMTPSIQTSTTENMTGNIPAISSIPAWVKHIFVFYGEGKISDNDLIGAIQFLIQQGIIKV